MDHKIIKKTLDNGLEIITTPVKQTHLVAVGFYIRCGSRNESPNINGISHFLEHLMFKGTKNYPLEILHEKLDELGHVYNATTGQDYTNYYIYGDNDNVFKIIDLLSDIFLNPDFKETDVDKEREVIIEEIRMRSSPDGYDSRLQKMFYMKLFAGTSLVMPVAGPEKNIRMIKAADIWSYREKFYQPNNTAIIVSGGIDSSTVIDYIDKKLSGVKNTAPLTSRTHLEKDLIVINKFITQQDKPRVTFSVNMNENVVGIEFNFNLGDVFTQSEVELSIISRILTVGYNSRLKLLIGTKLNTAPMITSGYNHLNNVGVFFINCDVQPNLTHDVIKLIAEELKKIRNEGFSEEEIKKAKKGEETGMMMALQKPTNLMGYYGDEAMHDSDGSVMKDFETVKSFDATKANVMVKEIFKRKRLNMLLYGHILDENFEYIENLL